MTRRQMRGKVGTCTRRVCRARRVMHRRGRMAMRYRCGVRSKVKAMMRSTVRATTHSGEAASLFALLIRRTAGQVKRALLLFTFLSSPRFVAAAVPGPRRTQRWATAGGRRAGKRVVRVLPSIVAMPEAAEAAVVAVIKEVALIGRGTAVSITSRRHTAATRATTVAVPLHAATVDPSPTPLPGSAAVRTTTTAAGTMTTALLDLRLAIKAPTADGGLRRWARTRKRANSSRSAARTGRLSQRR